MLGERCQRQGQAHSTDPIGEAISQNSISTDWGSGTSAVALGTRARTCVLEYATPCRPCLPCHRVARLASARRTCLSRPNSSAGHLKTSWQMPLSLGTAATSSTRVRG
ncbi:hypothetical protein MC885_009826 [Smutsia gigantea]|nr:hypothetical protein MC885_009826 [Smutsia gigantea]